jgi:hypothetical protein
MSVPHEIAGCGLNDSLGQQYGSGELGFYNCWLVQWQWGQSPTWAGAAIVGHILIHDT